MANNIKNKIAALKEIEKIFPDMIDITYYRLAQSLSIEEILSSDFENELLQLLKEYKSSESNDLSFFGLMKSGSFVSALYEKFDQNQIKLIIDKFFKLAVANKEYLKKFESEREFQNIELLVNRSKSPLSYVIQKIIDNELWGVMEENASLFDDFFNMTMSSAKYEEILKLHKVLTKQFADYAGYPLVVINPNVSKENKVEFITKTFKQKDMASYMVFIRNNMTDLTDLDSFIEATIISNARIKEKAKNIEDMFQRIFVGMRGEGWGRVNINKYLNAETFFKKYIAYFPLEKAARFVKSFSSYNQNRNAREFIVLLYDHTDLATKIRLATLDQDIGSSLFSDTKQIMKTTIKGDVENEKLFLKYIMSSERMDISNVLKDDFITYVNKYPETFDEYLKQKMNLDTMDSWYDSYKNIVEKLDYVEHLNSAALSRLSLLSIPRISLLGCINPESSHRWNSDQEKNLKNYKIFIDKLESIVKNSSEENRKLLFKATFAGYESEDFIKEDMFSSLTELLRDEGNIKEIKKFFKVSTDAEIIESLFKLTTDFLSKYYPEKTEILENLETLKKNIRLIMAL
jgi:hypothetical protein